MKKRLNDKYPDSTFYMIDDKLFFEYNSKDKITWVRYKDFWEKFESEFVLNYKEIKWLTRYTLEQHLKCKVFPTEYTHKVPFDKDIFFVENLYL